MKRRLGHNLKFNSKDEQCSRLAPEIYEDSSGMEGLGETPQCLGMEG